MSSGFEERYGRRANYLGRLMDKWELWKPVVSTIGTPRVNKRFLKLSKALLQPALGIYPLFG